MNKSNLAIEHCIQLLNFEDEVRQAETEKELSYLMVNRSHLFIQAKWIIYWQRKSEKKTIIKRISNIADIDLDSSPLMQELHLLTSRINLEYLQEVKLIELTDLKKLSVKAKDVLTLNAVYCPFFIKGKSINRGLIFLFENDCSTQELQLLKRFQQMFSTALAANLSNNKEADNISLSANYKWLIAIFIVLLFFLPLRQSLIAPAEIIASQPDVVTSPMNGVIEKILVYPNQKIKRDDKLLLLDKKEILHRYKIAGKVLDVARSKYLKTQQLAFHNNDIKAQLAILKSEMKQREAEVEYAKHQLERVEIKSNRDGVVILDNANDLIGKPVQIGEKMMTIANPDDVEIEISIPVGDLMPIEKGAEVELFLNIAPTTVWKAKISYISYFAETALNGQLNYRLLATLSDTTVQSPRIGLKGSVKIYGQSVNLFYYIFRRPISVMRQYLGL